MEIAAVNDNKQASGRDRRAKTVVKMLALRFGGSKSFYAIPIEFSWYEMICFHSEEKNRRRNFMGKPQLEPT